MSHTMESSSRQRRQSTDSTTAPSPDVMLREVAIAHIKQAQTLLEKTVLSDDVMVHPSRMVPGSTIGKHLRHLSDHFRLLLDAASSSEGVLNYDVRQRNVPMETNRMAAVGAFRKLRHRLEHEAPSYSRNLPLALHATTPGSQEFEANFGRELWFASLHATHHFALIRVIVTELDLDRSLPPEFGVAPATIKARL